MKSKLIISLFQNNEIIIFHFTVSKLVVVFSVKKSRFFVD